MSIYLFSDNPPDNPWQKKRYFRDKQKYVRFQRFYGNSLVGGTDQQKIITVKETGSKKKKVKRKESKQVSLSGRILHKSLNFIIKSFITIFFTWLGRLIRIRYEIFWVYCINFCLFVCLCFVLYVCLSAGK